MSNKNEKPKNTAKTTVEYLVQVNARTEYGCKRYYPVNRQAMAICSIKGRELRAGAGVIAAKYLTANDVEMLKSLGFRVEAVSITEEL